MEELGGWLGDERPYDRSHRKDEWASLIEDVKASFALVGSELGGLLPSMGSLLVGLHDGLGPRKSERDALHLVFEQVRTELCDAAAPGAAFADLVAAVQDPGTRTDVIEGRVDLIDALLRFSGRSLRGVASSLLGILNNDATYVNGAFYLLDDREPPQGLQVDEDAGLGEDERFELARRLIGRSQESRHHVVWVFYGNARISGWCLPVGACEFFDGPALMAAFGGIDEMLDGGGSYSAVLQQFHQVPTELIGDETLGKYIRGHLKWPSEDAWVAVRVDLGVGPFYDMVETAREQVRALLALAVFDVGQTSWTELTGYRHFADGTEGGSSMPFREVGFERRLAASDRTDSWLHDHRSELAARVTADPAMLHLPEVQAVVTATSVFAATADATPALTLLESVRVIETQASVLRIHWKDLVDQYATPGNALRRAQFGAAQAIEAIAYNDELRVQLPHLHDLPNEFNVYRNGQHLIDMSIAHDRIPHVVAELPTYNSACRKLRHVADDLATPASIAAFVQRERELDLRLLRRVHRVRNSLTHGGPSHPTIVRISSDFITVKAKHVTGVNVQALLDGEPLTTTLQNYKAEMTKWIANIATAADTTAALFPAKVRRNTT
ncbi:hypothetical protein ASE01_20485 [Nocardioides sp. Root190]|nr:hypothetical protein ASE01_20485 [Nocardioides sp. Root190]